MQLLDNEDAIVIQAQQGDKKAIALLYEAYVQRIFRYISYRVSSDIIAEDLTAEVFLKMVQHLPRYRHTGSPFGAWLFRIAANQIVDYRRQQGRIVHEPISESHKSDDHDLLTEIEEEEERSQLRRALQMLTEEQQTLLILRFMQHMSHEEVASIINKSSAAIRVMQHRALQALAKQLGDINKVRSYLRGEKQHG